MSRRRILAAAKRKGIVLETLDWDYDISRSGRIASWEVGLDEASAQAIEHADPSYKSRPDLLYCPELFLNAEAVIEWLNGFPDINSFTDLTAFSPSVENHSNLVNKPSENGIAGGS